MGDPLPVVTLARHGETAWSLSGQHTSVTDLPLTPKGERDAGRLGDRLRGTTFARVVTSPLLRARRTCELAGWATATVDDDLIEWRYGDFEGLTTEQIRATHPGWDLFRDGAPGGESVAEVSARADRVIGRLRADPGPTLVVSSGHILRVLAARWLHTDPAFGRYLYLSTAAVCVLGYDHGLDEPRLRLWNDVGHVGE
jgi:probable phosphoglycerate mutase